jgi:MoxR-like ATPase
LSPDELRARILSVRTEVAKVIVGQDAAVSGLVSALLVGGHVLIEGVPGVAKTLLVKTLARSLSLHFNRVQFTPDLMPTDVMGQMVFDSSDSSFRFRPGPVFTNFMLADEINRTPPKTQAALLEAMEESQVSIGGQTYKLPDPFVTIATQNPIEYEGTYPLPEAQLDRFLLKLIIDYPTVEQEYEVLARHHRGLDPHQVAAAGVTPVAGPEDIAAARALVRQVHVDDSVIKYIVDLCRATRESASVMMGVSPRGAAALLHGTKAWTWLVGRQFATPDEVQAMARPALRHRIMLRPELELDGLTTDAVLDSILAAVPAPR